MNCIVCGVGAIRFFSKVAEVDYFECESCKSIHVDPDFIDCTVKQYDDNYWKFECAAARERSFGSSLNRVSEVFYMLVDP